SPVTATSRSQCRRSPAPSRSGVPVPPAPPLPPARCGPRVYRLPGRRIRRRAGPDGARIGLEPEPYDGVRYDGEIRTGCARRVARPEGPGDQVLPGAGRRATGLRDPRQWPRAGRRFVLAQPPPVRLAEPGLAALP